MPFIHVNEYYINLDHIYYVHDLEHEYMIHFTGGETRCVSVSKSSREGEQFMQAFLAATKVFDGRSSG